MKTPQCHWLAAIAAAASVVTGLGCSSEPPALQANHPVALRLPAVAPHSEVRSLAITPPERPLIAGETVRIEGEYDREAIPEPPNRIYIEIRSEKRGKSIIAVTELIRDAEDGRYGRAIEIPEQMPAGEYELFVRTPEQFIGRSRVTVVKAEPGAAN